MTSGLRAILGIPGTKPSRASGDDQNDGICDLKFSRQRSESDDEEQQQQKNQFHRLDVTRQFRRSPWSWQYKAGCYLVGRRGRCLARTARMISLFFAL